MPTVYDSKVLGVATAYGYAVKHGYTGTEEQFGKDLASLGKNVTTVREIMEFVQTISEGVQSKVDEASASAEEAAGYVDTVKGFSDLAEGYKDDAHASAVAAQEVLDGLGEVEERVKQSERNAFQYSSDAVAAKESAEQFKNSAENSAGVATQSAETALNSAQSAEDSAIRAEEAAKRAEESAGGGDSIDDSQASLDHPWSGKKVSDELAKKLDSNQGVENANKILVVNDLGDVVPSETDVGKQGVTFTPTVSPDGVISWSNDGGLPNPESVSIRGPQGGQGEKGDPGEKGNTGPYFTPNVSQDGTISWKNNGGLSNPESVSIKGPKGEDGAPGKNGATGPYQFEINENGELLLSSIGEIPAYYIDESGNLILEADSQVNLGKVVGKDGTNGVDGHTPVRGVDYWTEEDKSQIIADVLAAIPNGDEVSY